MARSTRQRQSEPYRPKPVEKVELSEKHIRLRTVLTVVFLVIGAVFIGIGVAGVFGTEAGWKEIEAISSTPGCGSDFSFYYKLGAGKASARSDKQAVTNLYSEGTVEAFRLFNAGESYEGMTNLADLNAHPNETLTVGAELYRALEQIVQSGDRTFYMAPVYGWYGGLFTCEDDVQTGEFDPLVSPETAADYAEAAAFAGDSAHVEVELLGEGEGEVRLKVSEEYRAWAKENGVERFVDTGWMTNAFAADYIAEKLIAAGYTRGCLSSRDGFVRNLDASGDGYSLAVNDRRENGVVPAGVMEYTGPAAMVYLRDYPLSDRDLDRFYVYRSGEIRVPYLNGAGLPESARSDWLCYARDRSCVQVLLAMIPAYVTEELRREDVSRLAQQGIESVFCGEETIFHTEESASFRGLYQGEGLRYKTAVYR